MNKEKVLKAYILDEYDLKVKATKGFKPKYYVLDYTYDSQGGTWSTRKYKSGDQVQFVVINGTQKPVDRAIPIECYVDKRLANKLFDCVADIIKALEEN